MTAPCIGHDCDECKSCQSGRCCRRDNPDYQLPKAGDWQPFIGALGVLADDGERAECHICGQYFGRLGFHALVAHDVTPDEYRALFGLRRTTGLGGPRYLARMAVLGKAHSATLAEVGRAALAEMTPERRSYWVRGRRASIQEQIAKAAAIAEAIARPMVCSVCGSSWTAMGYEQGERTTCGEAACVSGAISQAQRKHGRYSALAPASGTCKVCGSAISGNRIVCSTACLLEDRRRVSLISNVAKRPAVREKIRAKASERIIDRDDVGRIRTWHRVD